MTRFTASKAELTPKYRRHFNPRLYSRACSRLFYLNISPSVVPRPQQRASFSRFPVSVFFTVSPSSPSPSPTPLSFLVPHPCRCSHPVSPVGSLFLSIASRQLLAVLPFSMTAGTLPSYPRATDYLCLRAKREMKAKLFDTADFPLSLSLFSFSFFRLSLFSLPPCCVSLAHPLTLYRSIPLSLCLSSSFRLFLSLSLYLSLAPFRYTRQPYFPLWLTRSRLLSFLPPRGCHPPSTLLIFPPLSLKLKSIVAPRARGLCRKHCYPHQLLPTQAPKGIFLRRQLISIDISSIEKISIFTSTKARLARARAQQCCKH